MIRRTKDLVGLELPEKTVSYIPTQLNPDQDAEYQQKCEDIRNSLLGKTNVKDITGTLLGGLQILRRITTISKNGDSGKIDFIEEELPSIVDSGDKVVIFSSFPNLVFPTLTSRLSSMNPAQYTGDMNLDERKEAHEKFINDPDCLVMCASLKAAGVGITWTCASYVYQMDLWWNPQVMQQAEDRVHRIGQKRPVFIKRLVANNTIDESVLKLSQKKQQIFEYVIDDQVTIINQTSFLEELLPVLGLRFEDLKMNSL